MGPTSDQLEREIGEVRGQMEARIIELRELGKRRARLAGKVALVAVGLGVAAAGAFVVWRLARPATPRERVQRLLPAGTFRDLWRMRETLELRGRRKVPPIRLYLGDRRVGEEPEEGGRWERIAVTAARVAGRAAAAAVVSRLLREVRPGSR